MRPRVIAALAALVLAGCGKADRPAADPVAATPTATPAPAASAPAADARLPREPAAIAAALADDLAALRRLSAQWDGEGRPPRDLTLHALHEQRLEYALVDRDATRRAVLARLRGEDRRAVRDGVRAEIDLAVLSSGWPVKRRFRTQAPEPAAALWRHYRRAHRRFGVSPSLLAAVNLVESAFGRLRNDSVAGAQGPMQFIPATGARTASAATSRIPATRSSAPPTTCTRTARRPTSRARCSTTTRRRATSAPSCATRGACAATRRRSTRCTPARCSCAPPTGGGASPAWAPG